MRGKLEFGVRVLWDADNVSLTEATVNQDALPAAVSGKDYMEARVAGYRLEKAHKEKADSYMRAINSRFMEAAAEKRVEQANGGRLMLSAAYLVEVERSQGFKEAFESIRASYPELRFLLSGPWSPYSFIRTL